MSRAAPASRLTSAIGEITGEMRIGVLLRESGRGRGGTTILTIYLVLQFAVPARLVVGPVGTPASVWGLFILLFWLAGRLLAVLSRGNPWIGTQKFAMVFLGAVLASYAAAMLRAIPAAETRAADRAVLFSLSAVGVVMLTCDTLDDVDVLDKIIGRLVTAVAILAAIGILQFFTGFDVTRFLHIPGLTEIAPQASVLGRDEFNRPAATAIHPIEFAVTLAMVFPLTLARALYAPPRARRRRWAAVLVMAVALPMTLSRSGMLGLLVAGMILLAGWPPARIKRALLIVPVFVVCMRLMVPGLIGTLRNLFFAIGSDSSTQSRANARAAALELYRDAPVFGRGMGTFLPENYFILDNQWLLTLVEMGIVGLVVILAWFGSGFVAARRARKISDDPRVRELGLSLSAGIAAIVVAFATYDAFSFPMGAGTAFLLLGCCGALYRSQRGRIHDYDPPAALPWR